jgi:hypothetical protein
MTCASGDAGGVIPVTQECLSGLLSAQRTTLSTIYRALHPRNFISVRRGRIHILDNSALRREACVCYDLVRRPLGRAVDHAGCARSQFSARADAT